MLITQQLNTVASQGGAKVAIRYLEKDTNYLQLKTSVARLSYLFLKEIGPTGRVGFLCSNSPVLIESFFALSNIRAVTVPLNPALTDEELGNWCKEARITHLAATNDLIPRARTFLTSQRISVPLIEIEKKHGGEYDTSYTAPPDKVPLETDLILLLRTAGISEKPRLVEFTHKQVTAGTMALKRPYHVNATDRFLTTLNWSNPFALMHGFVFPLLTGATCVIDHGLENQEFLQFVIKSRITRLVGTPSFFKKLLTLAKEEKTGLPGMKSATIGLSKASIELREAFEAIKVPACQVYGMTENLWTISMDDSQPTEEQNTNTLAGYKYKVVDENGDEIAGDFERTGQLCVTSPAAMSRYHLKDRETSDKASKQVLRGTWVYTGDLASLEGSGDTLKIKYLCRKEEALFKDGQYILPDKVDKALRGGPGIEDVAGFVTKDIQGHRVMACAIVKTPGPAIQERAVLDWCKGKAMGEARPVAYVFVDVIPYTAAGNVNRLSLGRQYSGISG